MTHNWEGFQTFWRKLIEFSRFLIDWRAGLTVTKGSAAKTNVRVMPKEDKSLTKGLNTEWEVSG